MFRNWGFLLGEIWGLLALAAALGIFAGWLIWSRGGTSGSPGQLRADLDHCRAMHVDKDDRIRALEAEISTLRLATAPNPAELRRDATRRQVAGVKPKTLAAARGGRADDLTRIRGIGPGLEAMCHRLGIYHFDQIASWSPEEVTWVDANLEGFNGRVSRDHWVDQAKLLASG